MAEFHYITDLVWDSFGALEGGNILRGNRTSFVYFSDDNYRIEITGAGFVYDANGLPTAGTLTGMQIFKGGVLYATFTGLSLPLANYVTLALGHTSGAADTPTDINTLYAKMRAGDDLYDGSEAGRVAEGYEGNDTLNGNGGDDNLNGGRGIDVLSGGDGFDGVYFGADGRTGQGVSVDLSRTTGQVLNDGFGNVETITGFEAAEGANLADRLVGNAGSNAFYGHAGRDTMVAGDGDDSVDGGAGADNLNGGNGIDVLTYFDVTSAGAGVVVNLSFATRQVRNDGFGFAETAIGFENVQGSVNGDRLTGNDQDNVLWGDGGDDVLTGGAGADGLYGEAGNDTIYGGAGDDDIGGDKGRDTYDGGTGIDRLGFWDVDATGHGVSVDLRKTTGQVLDDGYGNVETATGFERVAGSDFGDRLTGNAADNVLWGDDGNDSLSGDAGGDDLYGNSGRDILNGGSGGDWIMGGDDADTLTGGTDADAFAFEEYYPNGTEADHITDFAAGVDALIFNANSDTGLFQGQILSSQFIAGTGLTAATTSAQRLIYNRSTGQLFMDSDGSGLVFEPALVAILDNRATLTFDRIFIDYIG